MNKQLPVAKVKWATLSTVCGALLRGRRLAFASSGASVIFSSASHQSDASNRAEELPPPEYNPPSYSVARYIAISDCGSFPAL